MKIAGTTLAVGIMIAVGLTAGAAGGTQRVPVEVFASKADVGTYPIEIGMPFPVGTLSDAARIRLLDAAEGEVPCQVEVMSRYADGSLRAVLLVFLSPVSTSAAGAYTVEFGDGVSRTATPSVEMDVSQEWGNINIDTGTLRFQVGPGLPLLAGAAVGGTEILPEGLQQFVQEIGQPGIIPGEQAEVTLEESGPLRCVVLVKGRFGAAADAHSHQVRIHAYAGTAKPHEILLDLGSGAGDPAAVGALNAFLDAYEATGDEALLERTALVVRELIDVWKDDGYWSTGYGKHGDNGIAYSSRKARSVFRFVDLNLPGAGTGVSNDEVEQMLADCIETGMRSTVQAAGCSNSSSS